MFRELLIMARWRVFDKIVRHVRLFKFHPRGKLRAIGFIALWSVVLMIVLHMLTKHKHRY